MDKYNIFMKSVEWKWSNGEKAERTARVRQRKEPILEMEDVYEMQDESQVVNRCLYSAEEMLGLRETLDQGQQHLMDEFQRQPNKREDTYNRMAEREMVGQIGMNPFFSQNSNNNAGYIDDLMNQEQFMKPISTTAEKER